MLFKDLNFHDYDVAIFSHATRTELKFQGKFTLSNRNRYNIRALLSQDNDTKVSVAGNLCSVEAEIQNPILNLYSIYHMKVNAFFRLEFSCFRYDILN